MVLIVVAEGQRGAAGQAAGWDRSRIRAASTVWAEAVGPRARIGGPDNRAYGSYPAASAAVNGFLQGRSTARALGRGCSHVVCARTVTAATRPSGPFVGFASRPASRARRPTASAQPAGAARLPSCLRVLCVLRGVMIVIVVQRDSGNLFR
jgi:hypothetical protein